MLLLLRLLLLTCMPVVVVLHTSPASAGCCRLP
jgi:hypothetical protein